MNKEVRKKPIPYKDHLLKKLQDPEEAAAYLTAALDDNENPEVFLIALMDIVRA